MGIVETEELKTLCEDKPDDLFITCVSFEERCTKSLLLSENYKAKNIIVFDYHELKDKKAISKEAISRVKTNRKTILEETRAHVENEKNNYAY